jgi:hypothetical protein
MDLDKAFLGVFAQDGINIGEPIEGFNEAPTELIY